jgi:hypothetical protein
MNFEIVIENQQPLEGKIKFKGSKRGNFKVLDDGTVEYSLAVKTAREELDGMFETDDDKQSFFASLIEDELRNVWIEHAKEHGYTLAITKDGAALFFEGEPTDENIKAIQEASGEDIAEVVKYDV